MTRAEQMMAAAERYTGINGEEYSLALIHITNAFAAGWEEADKTMLDKACEWLTNYFVNYLQFDKQIINDFRKAMEGGEQ